MVAWGIFVVKLNLIFLSKTKIERFDKYSPKMLNSYNGEAKKHQDSKK